MYMGGNNLGFVTQAASIVSSLIPLFGDKGKNVVASKTLTKQEMQRQRWPSPLDADWDAYLGLHPEVVKEFTEGKTKFNQMWQGSGIAHPGEFYWRTYGADRGDQVPRKPVSQPAAPVAAAPPPIAPPASAVAAQTPAGQPIQTPVVLGPYPAPAQTQIYYPQNTPAGLTSMVEATQPGFVEKNAIPLAIGGAALLLLLMRKNDAPRKKR